MLHGHTKIELKNEKTGELQVVEKDNMITKALEGLFNDWFAQLGITTYITRPTSWQVLQFLPICPNSLGGILLFENTLEESDNLIYVPIDNTIMGYASNTVNTGTDTKQGSLNITESGIIENGYRFVWDFNTSQGNGQISALSLTHKDGGVAQPPLFSTYKNSTWTTNLEVSLNDNNMGALLNGLCIKDINDTSTISIYAIPSNSTIHIVSTNILLKKVNLLNNLVTTASKSEELDTITDSIFGTHFNYYGAFKYGNDGYSYGLTYDNNILYWIKININDHTYTEGTITFTSSHNNYSEYSISTEQSSQPAPAFTIKSGYIFILSDKCKYLHVISTDTMQEIEVISIENGIYSNTQTNRLADYFDYIVGYNFMYDIKTKTIKYVNIDTSAGRGVMNTIYQNRMWAMVLVNSDYNRVICVSPVTQYLATINNLDSPVIKTSEQSMKITYTITEE